MPVGKKDSIFKKEVKSSDGRKWTALCFFVLMSGVFQPHLYAEVKEYRLDSSQSKLRFEVGSTGHTLHGEGNVLQGNVSFDRASGEVSLPIQIEVRVDSLDTKNKRRDQHLRKMFQAEQYPLISWSASDVKCRAGDSQNTWICDADGLLTMHGITLEKKYQVILTVLNDSIKAEGSLIVQRNEFALKTPSLLGIIRVGQEVKVKFETVWITGKV